MVLHLQGDAMVSTGTGNLGVSVEKRPFLKRNFVSCDNTFLWNLTTRGRRQHCFTMHHKFEKVNKLLDNIPYLKLGGGRGSLLGTSMRDVMSLTTDGGGQERRSFWCGQCFYLYIFHVIKLCMLKLIPWVYPQIHCYLHKSLPKTCSCYKCVHLSPFISNIFTVTNMTSVLLLKTEKLMAKYKILF